MSQNDYEEISKLIEAVIGKNTIAGVKLLEGIKFYFDNRVDKVKIIKKMEQDNEEHIKSFNNTSISEFTEQANKAMKTYTAELIKEGKKYKKNALIK